MRVPHTVEQKMSKDMYSWFIFTNYVIFYLLCTYKKWLRSCHFFIEIEGNCEHHIMPCAKNYIAKLVGPLTFLYLEYS